MWKSSARERPCGAVTDDSVLSWISDSYTLCGHWISDSYTLCGHWISPFVTLYGYFVYSLRNSCTVKVSAFTGFVSSFMDFSPNAIRD